MIKLISGIFLGWFLRFVYVRYRIYRGNLDHERLRKRINKKMDELRLKEIYKDEI